jgi:hypothetical protein
MVQLLVYMGVPTRHPVMLNKADPAAAAAMLPLMPDAHSQHLLHAGTTPPWTGHTWPHQQLYKL